MATTKYFLVEISDPFLLACIFPCPVNVSVNVKNLGSSLDRDTLIQVTECPAGFKIALCLSIFLLYALQ